MLIHYNSWRDHTYTIEQRGHDNYIGRVFDDSEEPLHAFVTNETLFAIRLCLEFINHQCDGP